MASLTTGRWWIERPGDSLWTKRRGAWYMPRKSKLTAVYNPASGVEHINRFEDLSSKYVDFVEEYGGNLFAINIEAPNLRLASLTFPRFERLMLLVTLGLVEGPWPP